ncbi:DUF805 domain-containing protein [Candidatus Kaiserbacteria bacterium]|nr:DUF805 domain-containing protein [Candidatus Kaiserbacteria bacterium]
MYWYIKALKNYATFNGRAQRKEYWMFGLFNALIYTIFFAADRAMGTEFMEILYVLVLFIPSLAVTVRRLHDIDKSGWWYLIILVPIIGMIVLIVFWCLDSTPGNNRFGPNPKGIQSHI